MPREPPTTTLALFINVPIPIIIFSLQTHKKSTRTAVRALLNINFYAASSSAGEVEPKSGRVNGKRRVVLSASVTSLTASEVCS
mgnify:CR=1 FL=1